MEWIASLAGKLRDQEFDDAIKDPAQPGRRPNFVESARVALVDLRKKHAKVKRDDAPDDLQKWIDTYLTPDAWVRFRAAQRQATSHQKKQSGAGKGRETITKITEKESLLYAELAKAANVTKKEYMSGLAAWLCSDAGQHTAAQYAAHLNKQNPKLPNVTKLTECQEDTLTLYSRGRIRASEVKADLGCDTRELISLLTERGLALPHVDAAMADKMSPANPKPSPALT